MKRNGEGKRREGDEAERGEWGERERERRIPILLGWAAHIRMTVRTEKSSVCNVIVFMRMIVSSNSRSDPVINSTVPRNVNHRYRGNESPMKGFCPMWKTRTTLSTEIDRMYLKPNLKRVLLSVARTTYYDKLVRNWSSILIYGYIYIYIYGWWAKVFCCVNNRFFWRIYLSRKSVL